MNIAATVANNREAALRHLLRIFSSCAQNHIAGAGKVINVDRVTSIFETG